MSQEDAMGRTCTCPRVESVQGLHVLTWLRVGGQGSQHQ